MRDGTNSHQLSVPTAQGRLQISWELFRPKFGNTITIQTGAQSSLVTHYTSQTLMDVSALLPSRQHDHCPDRCTLLSAACLLHVFHLIHCCHAEHAITVFLEWGHSRRGRSVLARPVYACLPSKHTLRPGRTRCLTYELTGVVLYAADLLRFTVYRTDKGSLDKGGLPQPAFLNFDAELLFPVAHTMQVRLRGWSLNFPIAHAWQAKRVVLVGLWSDHGRSAVVSCSLPASARSDSLHDVRT